MDTSSAHPPKPNPRDPERIAQVREEKEQERRERDGIVPPAETGGTGGGMTDDPPDANGYVPHMSKEAAENLRPGDYFDHRDDVGKSLSSRVLDKRGTKVHVHYEGWASKWDTWSDYEKELWRFGDHHSLSARPNEREEFKSLAVKDYVEVDPKKHPGWKPGQIRRLDIDRKTQQVRSGQVQVQYRGLDEYGVQKEFLYWCHLDAPEEVQPMGSTAPKDNPAGPGSGQAGTPTSKVLSYDVPQYDPMYGKLLTTEEKPDQNTWSVMDWLEVQDTIDNWEVAMVLEVRNNWIKIHYDQWSTKWDETLHVVRDKDRIRGLGAAVPKCDMEIEIEEDLKGFRSVLKEKESGEILEMKADGNCLYRGVAQWIYDDQEKYAQVRQETCDYMEAHKDFFKPFLGENFEAGLVKKRQNMEWGDHDDITAMSEKYNCRFRVFEYNREKNQLYDSLVLGEHNEQCKMLPLVLLSRHRGKHYNVVQIKKNKAFIGGAETRDRKAPLIRNFRVKMEQEFAEKVKQQKERSRTEVAREQRSPQEEEEKAAEAAHDSRDRDEEMAKEPSSHSRHSSQRSPGRMGVQSIQLADSDLDAIWSSARKSPNRRSSQRSDNWIRSRDLDHMWKNMITMVMDRLTDIITRTSNPNASHTQRLQKCRDRINSDMDTHYGRFYNEMERMPSTRQSSSRGNNSELFFTPDAILKHFNESIVEGLIWRQVVSSSSSHRSHHSQR